MRATTELFKVNGRPMLAPDLDMGMSFEDIDSADTGRDEAGVMHRIMVRFKVGTWSFSYSGITSEEYEYMESLFPEDGDFTFTHPSRTNSNSLENTKCYRSKYSISWYSVKNKLWRNYKFNIIEC